MHFVSTQESQCFHSMFPFLFATTSLSSFLSVCMNYVICPFVTLQVKDIQPFLHRLLPCVLFSLQLSLFSFYETCHLCLCSPKTNVGFTSQTVSFSSRVMVIITHVKGFCPKTLPFIHKMDMLSTSTSLNPSFLPFPSPFYLFPSCLSSILLFPLSLFSHLPMFFPLLDQKAAYYIIRLNFTVFYYTSTILSVSYPPPYVITAVPRFLNEFNHNSYSIIPYFTSDWTVPLIRQSAAKKKNTD